MIPPGPELSSTFEPDILPVPFFICEHYFTATIRRLLPVVCRSVPDPDRCKTSLFDVFGSIEHLAKSLGEEGLVTINSWTYFNV